MCCEGLICVQRLLRLLYASVVRCLIKPCRGSLIFFLINYNNMNSIIFYYYYYYLSRLCSYYVVTGPEMSVADCALVARTSSDCSTPVVGSYLMESWPSTMLCLQQSGNYTADGNWKDMWRGYNVTLAQGIQPQVKADNSLWSRSSSKQNNSVPTSKIKNIKLYHYKHQFVNDVSGNNRCLLWETFEINSVSKMQLLIGKSCGTYIFHCSLRA
jgi:hypothetical protein